MPHIPNKLPFIHQLPFPFHRHEQCTFENFYDRPNIIVSDCLKQLIKQPDLSHSVYLWGQHGVGCSHLLKASTALAEKTELKATYLSLSALIKDSSANLLDLVQSSDMLCLDDIEAIAGHSKWEESLFEVYNLSVTKRIPMVFAAHQVPYNLNFKLPDLISRLNSGLLFKIHPLSDTQKIAALQLRARLRGCELPNSVAQFLLFRLHRNPGALLQALNQLDLFSLAQKRKLTMPFVKAVLEL